MVNPVPVSAMMEVRTNHHREGRRQDEGEVDLEAMADIQVVCVRACSVCGHGGGHGL